MGAPSSPEANAYEFQSNGIIDMLEKLLHRFTDGRLALEKEEMDARHAFDMLRPGGLLVSLCFDGVKQNKNLKPWSDSWETLPVGTFKSEGTRAGVALITKRVT